MSKLKTSEERRPGYKREWVIGATLDSGERIALKHIYRKDAHKRQFVFVIPGDPNATGLARFGIQIGSGDVPESIISEKEYFALVMKGEV